MRAAIVSPTEYLREIQPFSNYHLCLVHKVIYDKIYQNFYRQRSKAGDYIILDNSAVEKKGRAVPVRDIVTAAILIKPSAVVLPDFLFDGERTLKESHNALHSPSMYFLRRVHPTILIAAVVQGLDEKEWLKSFEVFNASDDIDLLCIPKVTGQTFGVRWEALNLIKTKVKKPCHLLGSWWQSTLDDLRYEATFDFVQGIDTPKPIRLAVQGKRLAQWSELEHDRGFLDRKQNGVDLELLRQNCREFVGLCSG